LCSIGYGSEYLTDYDSAIALSRDSQKNVLIVFSLVNCKYCDILKNDLKDLKYLDNYIVCILDSRNNKKLTGKMNIKKWPTSVVVTVGAENQGEVSRLIGYENKMRYDAWLKANAAFFGEDGVCGCDCADNCVCRKDGICTCCGDKKCSCKK
jgi:hypothetical protein